MRRNRLLILPTLVTVGGLALVAGGCSSAPPATPSSTGTTQAPGLHEIGVGGATTKPLVINASTWAASWQFSCPVKSVFTFHAEGTGNADGKVQKGAAAIAKSGAGLAHFTGPGTFLLVVAAGPSCKWTLVVTQS